MRKVEDLVIFRLAGLAMLWALPLAVEAQYTYTTNNGTITITRYTGPGGDVTLPSTINGLSVTSIGANAFNDTAVLSVAIPNTVTRIENHAFWRSAELERVTIPDSVISIGDSAFSSCLSLAQASIPNAVTDFGTNVFSGCVSLTICTLGTNLTTIGEESFYGCQNLSSVTIPDSVTNIGSSAFSECDSLTNVTIGNGVTSMGDAAFFACRSLTNLKIGTNVTSIGYLAFAACTSLASVTIPDGVTSIGDEMFGSCSSLTNVTIGHTVTSIGIGAFMLCRLGSVYFMGNAPTPIGMLAPIDMLFDSDPSATVYYLPGTTSWSNTFAGRPTAVWKPQVQTKDVHFGIRTNQFGFNIKWASGMTVVVETSPSLFKPVWTPLSTNTLASDTAYFSDPQWTNHPARFYRLRWP